MNADRAKCLRYGSELQIQRCEAVCFLEREHSLRRYPRVDADTAGRKAGTTREIGRLAEVFVSLSFEGRFRPSTCALVERVTTAAGS